MKLVARGRSVDAGKTGYGVGLQAGGVHHPLAGETLDTIRGPDLELVVEVASAERHQLGLTEDRGAGGKRLLGEAVHEVVGADHA